MTAAPHVPARIDTRDRCAEHPQGRIFTRSWAPAEGAEPVARPSPILLLHDSLGCVELWRDFPAALSHATGREVIAYDRLGFGKSAPRTGRPTLGFVAEEASVHVPVILEQLGVDGFIALGHSVGGGMAVQCAAALAPRCEALVTVAAQVFPEDRTLEGIRAAKEQFNDPAQVERLARYHGEKTRWVLDAWIGNWLDPGFACWSLADVLPQVSCPVLAIHGELDEYGSTRHPELIGRLAKGPARVEILPGVGHVPHRERPEQVLGLVAGFLRR
jgi:pimeloyl-ACP methyl ester carboxylesterase